VGLRRRQELLDSVFDDIFKAFEGKAALILDLTLNQGGFEAATDLIAGRFADRKRHVMNVCPRGESPPQGNKAWVMRSPRVKLLGERTRGYLSSLLNKRLPAGFAISISNASWLSPQGVAV
jgi:C-terminal processing protease CtpA/Prc